MFRAGFTFCFLFFLCAGVSAEFIHPGISHNRDELDFVKGKIDSGEEPWATAGLIWAALNMPNYPGSPNP